jgi:hypothetical protein
VLVSPAWISNAETRISSDCRGKFATPFKEECIMLVILRLLKTLSRAIAEAKMQRIERELMMRGIPYRPFPRSPRD